MFSGPSDNTWMKGDTFLEVASVLVRTDIDNVVSFNSALEVVKRYVRAKMKKGKGKEVAGKGGKLEALEVKYAHLGFQDIFYLTRLQLSLPPSAIKLPRPTSPTRKQLVKARYPLPEEYQLGRDDLRGSVSSALSGPRDSVSERGRSMDVRAAPTISPAIAAALDPSRPTSSVTAGTSLSSGYNASTPSLSRSASSAGGTSAIPTPLPMPSPTNLNSTPRSPLAWGAQNTSMRRAPSGSSIASGASLNQNASGGRIPRSAGNDEGDVKRMLEARIKALQSALDSLDVQEEAVPEPALMDAPLPSPTRLTPFPGSFRRDLPPLAPPPNAPLPPTPLTPASIRSAASSQGSPQTFIPSFPTPPTRTSIGTLSPPPSMPSELPDPFAPSLPAVVRVPSRADRERAAWLRSQDDLRRIKAEVGEVYPRGGGATPPPTYEA